MIFTICYVEDNAYLRETIGALMEAADREIALCATGEEALAVCTQRHVDLLVTDVNLPGVSGTDLARKLLQSEPQRWIVLCSGYDFSSNARVLGPNVRALSKPFEIEELDALIDEVRASRPRRCEPAPAHSDAPPAEGRGSSV